MPANDATAHRYDAMPYESHAFHETHPDHLATLATLHGMSPAALSSCRVLELGCASGGNLIPMALGMPGASFLGIDLSPRQIDEGREIVDSLGLRNLELQARNLSELNEEIGRFDYVIAHGLYSWVPEPVRAHLLVLIAKVLAPEGVAFVSYNTLPGWHLLSIVRDMMLFHVDGIDDPAAQVRAAREFLDTALDAMPEKTTAYAQSIRREVEQLRTRSDSYLLHEFLEPASRPVYVREFAEHAARHGLRYLTDARYRTEIDSQPEDLRALLDQLSDDPIRREQYLDFIRNRTFRRTVLVHEAAPAGRRPDPSRIQILQIATASAPVSPFPEVHTDAPEVFRSFDGAQRLTTTEPLVKTALATLFEVWPHSLPFQELHRRTLARLDEAGGSPFPREEAAFQAVMLRCYGAGVIDLRSSEPPFARIPGARPKASPYARHQAATGRLVTNLLHRVVELSEFDRLLVSLLDGTRDRSSVVDALVAAVVSGRFPLSRDGSAITDAIEVRQIMQRSFDAALPRLGGSVLLMEPSDAPGEGLSG